MTSSAWHLHPKHWGHGYATEAAAAVLRRAYAAGVAEVVALIHPENERSKQVAMRLGMEYQGRYYSDEAELYLAKPDGSDAKKRALRLTRSTGFDYRA